MSSSPRLGSKVRALRRREGLTQARLAERLEISASYLNLIEHDKRPLTAPLLIRLAGLFDLDLQAFAADDDAQLTANLMEVFGDPVFEEHGLTNQDVRELVSHCPASARAVLGLYETYQGVRERARSLAARLTDDDLADEDGRIIRAGLPSEEVHDLVQKHRNHFGELEEAAEGLWSEGQLDRNDLYAGLKRHLEERLGVEVRIERARADSRAVRRYDPIERVVRVSEVLPPRSRNFQLAHQIGLLTQGERLDRLAGDRVLTTDESRSLARVVLANYFAGAVLMPYQRVLEAARESRYDIELLGHHIRVSFEQVCHRLTTLRKPGAEGVPFHLLRIDLAGNISKHFSASGIRFARFSGVCPKWAVHSSVLTPGLIRTQLSRMPDGAVFFSVARTLSKGERGYHASHQVQAIELGCRVEHARELVYSDGIDLTNLEPAVPIGVTCRLCERTGCEQRAMPSIQHPLRIDENVRGVGFYMSVDEV